MGIRFAKSIKLGDLLKINISKSGVSATIGKKGASVNVGSKGTYLNLSPTIAGITGTGVSYRQKITGGYGSLLNKLTNNNKENESKEKTTESIDTKVIEEYVENLNASINVHKLSEKVLTKDEYIRKIDNENNDSTKQIYNLSLNGDEDTIESLIGSFMMNLDFPYPIKSNYELEDDILYVDLDLPEIDELIKEYPEEVKNKIVNKKKTQSQLKQEYAYTVMSLSVYLASEFFNLSPYIEKIILSGFTSRRNKDGDLNDDFLYSIKYSRKLFETTDFSNVDDIYEFIMKFENRINFNSANNTFKSIKPFEMPSVEKNNDLIDEAISGLKELGYKNATINEIIPKLNEIKCETSGEYLKEALKLLAANK